MAMQWPMPGQVPDREHLGAQTLDSMIDSELLGQDAQDRGYEATDDDVQNLLEETANANQMGSVDELVEAYGAQGITEIGRASCRERWRSRGWREHEEKNNYVLYGKSRMSRRGSDISGS